MRTRNLLASALLSCCLGLGAACSAAGPITSAVVQAACSFIPLLVQSPEGVVVAGTVCKDAEPLLGPIVSAIVAAFPKGRRLAMSTQLASATTYKDVTLSGKYVASVESSIAAEVQAKLDALPKDGGK